MQTPNLFTSNLARFHKFRYDMVRLSDESSAFVMPNLSKAIDHFDRREDSAAKQIFIELTQDAFTPVIWKAFSYYMLAIFSPISMANINLDHARRIGRLLQDEETRVAFLRDVVSYIGLVLEIELTCDRNFDKPSLTQQRRRKKSSVSSTQQFLRLSHHQDSVQQR